MEDQAVVLKKKQQEQESYECVYSRGKMPKKYHYVQKQIAGQRT